MGEDRAALVFYRAGDTNDLSRYPSINRFTVNSFVNVAQGVMGQMIIG